MLYQQLRNLHAGERGAHQHAAILVDHEAHLARRAVPLLITDYLLRGMDGLALTDAVKAASRSTYVVLVTMDDSLGLAAQARAHQVDRLLIKWDVFTELEDVVRTVLPIAPTGA